MKIYTSRYPKIFLYKYIYIYIYKRVYLKEEKECERERMGI